MNSHKTVKFAKVFSLESFPLYGITELTLRTDLGTRTDMCTICSCDLALMTIQCFERGNVIPTCDRIVQGLSYVSMPRYAQEFVTVQVCNFYTQPTAVNVLSRYLHEAILGDSVY